MFFDSHCHLTDPAFATDRDEVVARARQAGVVGMTTICSDPADLDALLPLARAHSELWATAGIHPHEARHGTPEALERIRAAVREEPRVRAVGECGLDYHYDHSPRDEQRAAFAAQLDLAAETRRPVVVHTRLAESDTMAMIADAAKSGVVGVMHCFTGSHALAQHALDGGWYISFSGIVTFRKWDDEALLRMVPDDRLLVESDAPYLAPVPHRGKRNEPAWVSFTVARLAQARGITPAELGAAAADNATRLFGLAPLPRA